MFRLGGCRVVPAVVRCANGQRKMGDSHRSFLGRCRDFFMKMIATHLGAHPVVVYTTPVSVYRTTGESDEVAASEVSVRDLLCLSVQEEATHPNARAATKNALNQTTQKPNETIWRPQAV